MKFWIRGILAVVVVIGGIIAFIVFAENRPRNLFTKYISETLPRSVVLRHGESRISGAVVFLEFGIGRNDLEAITRAHHLSREQFSFPTQPPRWFAPADSWEYWKGDGGRQELWYSTTNQIALYRQVNG